MKLFGDKRFRYGTFSTAMMLFAVVIFVLVNLLASEFNRTYDLTREQLFTLTNQSINFLQNLDREVHITYISRTGNENGIIINLFEEYMSANSLITVETRDPAINPMLVHELAARAGEDGLLEHSVVVESGGRITVVSPRVMIIEEWNWQTGRPEPVAFNFEAEITRAIHFVSQGDPPVVYFVTGSGERDILPEFFTFLEAENFIVRTVNPIMEEIPESADILYVSMPTRDFTDAKADRLIEFMRGGGSVYFSLGFRIEPLPNLERVLEYYGLILEDFLVFEGDPRNFFSLPFNIFPIPFLHDITENLHVRNFANALIGSTALSPAEVRRASITVHPLWTTSDSAFGRVDFYETSLEQVDSDVEGPFILAAAIEDSVWLHGETTTTRIVITASADILHPEVVRVIGQGNWQFVVNSLRWMMGEPPGIWIPPRLPPGQAPLMLSELSFNIRAGASMGLIPLTVIGVGTFVWFRRRNA